MSATDTRPVPPDSTHGVALSAKGITVEYRPLRRPVVRAVDDVSLELANDETLGLVGESGCGKSSLGRSLVLLPRPTLGTVALGDTIMTDLSDRELRPLRRRIQLIFQDPISSLNPGRSGVDIVAEPLKLTHHESPRERALEVLAEVGVDERMASRRPHQLSGGQCQRISIARAIVQQPEVLICDEPVSALDVSVQAQVLNLLRAMKEKHRLSVIFISHDLAAVKHASDRIAVMYLGKICEIADATGLHRTPKHHYTAALLASVPQPGVKRPRHIEGEVPSEYSGVGCRFAARCPAATELCRSDEPQLLQVSATHSVACHHPLG